jgi:hypothetical protein
VGLIRTPLHAADRRVRLSDELCPVFSRSREIAPFKVYLLHTVGGDPPPPPLVSPAARRTVLLVSLRFEK